MTGNKATIDLGEIHHSAVTTSGGNGLIVRGLVFIGNPHGVRNKDSGRCHNQRMAQWEYGKDLSYFGHKFKMAGISVLIGSERGTSSTCPECGHRHKPKGRTWNCPKCSYKKKHRDITGSLNMHRLAFGEKAKYPENIKYLRPVQTGSSRCADTRQRSLILANTSSTSFEGNQMIPAQSISDV